MATCILLYAVPKSKFVKSNFQIMNFPTYKLPNVTKYLI